MAGISYGVIRCYQWGESGYYDEKDKNCYTKYPSLVPPEYTQEIPEPSEFRLEFGSAAAQFFLPVSYSWIYYSI